MQAISSGESIFFNARDGARLHCRFWAGMDNGLNNRVIVAIPGLGNHSGSFAETSAEWIALGLDVFAVDLRGHGVSDGSRGALADPKILISDLKVLLELVRHRSGRRKVYLLGESLGATLALAAASTEQIQIEGLILIAPALKVKLTFLLDRRNILDALLLALSLGRRKINLLGWRLEAISRCESFVQQRRRDNLTVEAITLKYLVQASRLIEGWHSKYAPRINVPTLIIHGTEDRLLDAKASERLHDRLAAEDKTLRYMMGVYHTALWDPNAGEIIRLILNWLDRH